MAGKKVSLKDFSAELGISVSTVSRALKNHPDISQEVKQKVNSLAKKWNYQTSTFSIGFKNPATKTIGVVVPDIVRFFYSSIISGIESFAKDNGYFIVIANSRESFEKEKECIQNLIRLNVDGIIVCLSQETSDYSHFDLVRHKDIPLVFFDRVCRTNEFSSVIADNADAAKEIVNHLHKSGAKRIAHIAGPKNLNITKERIAGYLMSLNDNELEFDKDLLIYCDLSRQDAIKSINKLLSSPKVPDAIFCVNDTVAYVAMKEIKNKGLRIPDDIALVGFNDEFHSTIVEPTLTTVLHPTDEMGKETARLLIEQIESGQPHAPRQIVMKTSIVIRESSIKNKL
ncbi:MAG: LacI family DNA-binding transcriptional regulator [Marinilabiliaceae bacterium]|nr:LacI family DNA-binding transcriptional regulator [Marinilabiliaceae bacterium]